jgi:hypothetical protein
MDLCRQWVRSCHSANGRNGPDPDGKFGWKADISPSSGPAMSASPTLKLSALRDIGWGHWNPMELNGAEGGWRRSYAANEYDRYMLHVTAGMQSGKPDQALVDYLFGIETDHMRLNDTPAARARATATISAIRAYVSSRDER